MRAGFIGVGAMGLAMAGHAARKGHEVIATDIAPSARDAAVAQGLSVTDTLADLAHKADVFVVVVVTDAQSRAVTEGLLAAGVPQGSVIAIAATNHPATMVELEEACARKGVGFIDAPVVFGLKGAQEGRLGTLVGGAAQSVEQAWPLLESYSAFVEHVGAIGAGQLAKTCNNMLHWAACVANFEVLLLAKRYGIDAQKMREILLKCPGKNITLERWDSTKFTWHEKDLDVALDLSQAGDLSLPLFGQVDQLVKGLNAGKVRDLLYGPAADYLGQRVEPLSRDEGTLFNGRFT